MKVQLIAISLLLLVSACSSSSTTDSGIPAQSGKVQISNWPTGQSAKILFAPTGVRGSEFSSADVSATGEVSFSLPTPTGLGTRTYSPGTECTGTLDITPSDWESLSLTTIPVYLGGNTELLANGFIGVLPISTSFQEGQSFLNDWIYVEKPTSITGTYQCSGSNPTTTFSVQFKAGWNYLLTKIVKMSGNQATQIETYASQFLPSNYHWVYQPRRSASK